jgi:D-tyrosyl-tRNA(Tyr) deacylase
VRALLQRVTSASVSVADDTIGQVGLGWLVLVGVGHTDTEAIADSLADKIVGLRCFEDAQGKTNLALTDVGGAVLLVSQFTLYADTTRGRRPGFTNAAQPDRAEALVAVVAQRLRARGVPVSEGRFGAHMRVTLVNDGPFTIWLDTDAGSAS